MPVRTLPWSWMGRPIASIRSPSCPEGSAHAPMSPPRRPEPRSSAEPITPIGRLSPRDVPLSATAANTTVPSPPRPATGGATALKGYNGWPIRLSTPLLSNVPCFIRRRLHNDRSGEHSYRVVLAHPDRLQPGGGRSLPRGAGRRDTRLDRPGRAAQRIVLPDAHRVQPGGGRSVPGIDRRPA